MLSKLSQRGTSLVTSLTLVVVLLAIMSVALAICQSSSPVPNEVELCCSVTTEQSRGNGPNVVVLKAGTSYKMGVLLDQNVVATGGTWRAENGHFVAGTDNYNVPIHRPAPLGYDTLTYTEPGGDEAKEVQVTVWVEVNPEIPGSGEFNTFDWSWDVKKPNPSDPADPRFISTSEIMSLALGFLPELLPTEPAVIQGFGGTRPTTLQAFQPSGITEIPLETFAHGVNGFTLPASIEGLPTEAIVIEADPQKPKPQVGKVDGPLFTPPSPGECEEGRVYYVNGPITTTCLPTSWLDMGSQEIYISAEASGKIFKIFGIKITGNSTWKGNIWSKELAWRQVYYRDMYVCIAGVWEFASSQRCFRTGTGLRTIPAWYAWMTGYPPNGDPKFWTSWTCNRFPPLKPPVPGGGGPRPPSELSDLLR